MLHRTRRSTSGLRTLTFALTLALTTTAARAYDALADWPDAPRREWLQKSAAPPVASISVEAKLGLPSFLRAGPHPTWVGKLGDPVASARAHLVAHSARYAISAREIAALAVRDVQRLPRGAALVRFASVIDGIEVFREQATVLMDARGALVAIGGYVSGDPASLSARPRLFALDARDAAERALGTNVEASNAKRVWFRLPSGLVPAWYFESPPADARPGSDAIHAYVVSAQTGERLFEKNLVSDAHAYRAYAETEPPFLPLPGPEGRSVTPHPTGVPDTTLGTIGAANAVTLDHGPISTNDPWLAPGAVDTRGNNVDAYVDLVAPDGYNGSDRRAPVTAPGVFDHAYDFTLEPTANATQGDAAVVNAFYVTNWLHDWFYDAGFTESAGNAQQDNYGRGGVGGDSLRVEISDYAGVNNANMFTPPDGGRPRMQMYVWAGDLRNRVTFSQAYAGVKESEGSNTFGPQTFDVTGQVAIASDAGGITTSDGCEVLTNGSTLVGRIALVDRGNCDYGTKAQNAQNAGAIGVLVANNVPNAAAPGMGGAYPGVTIAAASLATADGAELRAVLAGGGIVTANLVRERLRARAGGLDGSLVAHEWGHYLSNRLVANTVGLGNSQGRAMGEGFADFTSILMLLKAGDATLPAATNWTGAYATGAHSTTRTVVEGPQDRGAFYGLRRWPASTDFGKSPLTFRHIANGQALPTVPAAAVNALPNAQEHNSGEVWAVSLLECYAGLLRSTPRLAFADAQDRMKRYLVAGLKLTPANPTYVEARDALLAAMYAEDRDDYDACAAGFARRGLGGGAIAPGRYDAGHAGVVESYTVEGALEVASIELDDAPGYCDADGIFDRGETGSVTVTVRNTGLSDAGGTLALGGDLPGLLFPTGATRAVAPVGPTDSTRITIPVRRTGTPAVAVGEFVATLTNEGGAQSTLSRAFRVDYDEVRSATVELFETRRPPWTTRVGGNVTEADGWALAEDAADAHHAYGVNAAAGGETSFVSPPLQATTGFGFTFRHRHAFEEDVDARYDGGRIEISTDDGASWSDIGGSATPTYNGTLFAYAGNLNPFQGLSAYSSRNASYPAYDLVTVSLGDAYAGQTVRVRFRIGTDNSVGAEGWRIDDVAFTGIANAPFDEVVLDRARCHAIAAASGTPQRATAGTPFAQALSVGVTQAGSPAREGLAVVFDVQAAPGGATARFAGNVSFLTVTTDANGVATAPALVASALPGSYTATARVGLVTTTYALANDYASAPAAPALLAADDTGSSASDRITRADPLRLEGDCTNGESIALSSDDGALGTVTCANGRYAYAATLANGAYVVTAKASRDGVSSDDSAALALTVDRDAPAAPLVASVTPADAPSVRVDGTSEPNAAIVARRDGVALCTTVADGAGAWHCDLALGYGTHALAFVATDVAGNASAAATRTITATVPSDALFANGFE